MLKKRKKKTAAVNDYRQALVCALLRLKTDGISTIELKNPIVLGEHAEEKDIILDVNVCLIDPKMLDLEMQVADEKYSVTRYIMPAAITPSW